jgi:hypothetical protein
MLNLFLLSHVQSRGSYGATFVLVIPTCRDLYTVLDLLFKIKDRFNYDTKVVKLGLNHQETRLYRN